MTRVYFTRTVKYHGVVYNPQTAVEVDDGDIVDLKADGLIVVNTTETPEVVQDVVKPVKGRKKKNEVV